MLLAYYYYKTKFSCIKSKKSFEQTDVYKSKLFFESIPPQNRKNKLRVYKELRALCKYWKCFPEVYFNFSLFRREYNDFEQIKSFIPQQAYARYATDKYPQYHILVDDKILFHNIMRMYGLPVPERFFVFQDNTFFKDDHVISDQEVDAIIESIKDDRIFIKRFKGGAASGIYIAVRKEDGYYTSDGKKLSSSMIHSYYGNSNYIFEKQLIQEDVLRSFNPDTVNTIRITTYNNEPVSAAIRFGLKGSYVDNLHAGGVGVSVDLKTGELGEYGARNYDSVILYAHPSSGKRFKGTIVPGWNEILMLVKKTLQCIPYYKSVGFDIVTTDNGPVIIEINTGCGMDIAQMGKKRGIADRFKN